MRSNEVDSEIASTSVPAGELPLTPPNFMPSSLIQADVTGIDLTAIEGKVCARIGGKLTFTTSGHKHMKDRGTYELIVLASPRNGMLTMKTPTERAIDLMPNDVDIVRCAFGRAYGKKSTGSMMYDITCISFEMRSRIYTKAQSNIMSTRRASS